MRKILEKYYNSILMKSGPISWTDRQATAVVHYLLFPEFRKRSYRKYLTRVVYGLLLYSALSVVVEASRISDTLDLRNKELYTAYNKIDFIMEHAFKYVYGQVQDSFLVSDAYLRYKMHKETGITVPKKVSSVHLQTIATLAEKNDLPLKIYLRVIYHESSFDSTAVNKTSGAFGYCQTMPSTFDYLYDKLNLEGGRTAINNLTIGASLLSKEYKYWRKRRNTSMAAWEMALACYAMGAKVPRELDAVPEVVRPYVDYVLHKKEL